METSKIIADYISMFTEIIGILIIFLGTIYSLYLFSKSFRKKDKKGFVNLRKSLGKSILLGLEVLIGADIISTVVTEPTVASLSILGFIILIRTFLSLSLQVELDGKFPWQKEHNGVKKIDW